MYLRFKYLHRKVCAHTPLRDTHSLPYYLALQSRPCLHLMVRLGVEACRSADDIPTVAVSPLPTASGVRPNGCPAWTRSLPPSLFGAESPPQERVYGEAGVQLGLSDPEGTRGRLHFFPKSLLPLEPARSEFVRSPLQQTVCRACPLPVSEQVYGKVYKGGWTVALVRNSRSETSRGWKFPQNKNVTLQTCTGPPRTAGREPETRRECNPL